jgi:hypothetical protein
MVGNLLLQFCFTLEMPVPAVYYAVVHGEKRQPESYNRRQKPHGKPHSPVAVGFALQYSFHVNPIFPVKVLTRLEHPNFIRSSSGI